MNQQLHLAVQLNNEGVASLFDGNKEQARCSLSTALQILRESLHALKRSNDEKNGHDIDDADQFDAMTQSSWPQHCRCVELPLFDGEPCDDSDFSNNEEGVIFDSAILLPELTDADCADVSHRTVISVVLFNTALMFHLSGRTESKGKDATAALGNAEILYGSIQKFLDFPASSSDSMSSVAYLLQVATTNNLAVLLHQRGDYGFGWKHFQFLASLLQWQPNEDCCFAFDECPNEMILHQMHLNIFLAKSQLSQHAACA